MATDFTKITPCGGCCENCEFYQNGACKGCISTGGERTWEGRKSVCEICTCCREHNVSFCGICEEFPCDWIVKKIDWDKDAIEKLKNLRDEYLSNVNDYSCNNSMKKLLEKADLSEKNHHLDRMIAKIVSADIIDTRDFGDFIIQQKNAADSDIGRQAIIEKYQDLTGYEHFCNETYISVQNRDDLSNAVVLLRKYLIDSLKEKFPGKRFCVIISVDLGEYTGITAHYHRLRDGEFLLDKNLESYDQPVLYILT